MKTFFILILIVVMQINCFSQKKEKPIFLLFENNVDGMFKRWESNSDSCYYYSIKVGRSYSFGFEPIKEGKIIPKYPFFENNRIELKNITWIRHISANYPDSLNGKKNIFIIEKLDNNSFSLTQTKYFEALE